MAIANAGTVQVDFQAGVATFNRQLTQINSSLKKSEVAFQSLGRVAQTALAFLGAGFGVQFIKSAADAADQLGKTADKLRISTEALTAFQLAAEDAGVAQETFNKLLVDSQRRLGDAAAGRGEALEFLRAFGLNIRELQALSPDELFLRYADSIATLKNRSDQFAAAQALFGRSAQEAFTLIEAGRPAIEEAAATVDKLGLALSRVDIRKIEEANDKLALLGKTSQAFGQQIAAAFAPFITEFVNRLTESGAAADDARTKLDAFARASFFAFEIIANAARTFDVAVSGAFLAFFASVEKVASAFGKMRELQAEGFRALGLDTLANDFQAAQSRFAEVEGFAAAASEQAAARVKSALDNIKSFEQISAEADRIVAEAQARAAEAVQRQREIAESGTFTFDSVQIERITQDFFTREQLQEMHYQRLLDMQRIYQESSAKITEELDVNQFIFHQQQREQAAIAAENAILQARQLAANAGLGLLQAFAGKSKTIAIALVAINKARAIAEAIQNTGVAVTRTLASLPYPANVAAAAKIKALGALQVAAIAATGLAEIQQIRDNPGSGAPLGSPVNPVNTTSTDAGGAAGPLGANQRTQITVQVVGGGPISRQTAMEIATGLKDVIDNADVHLISQGSSQAQEIRGG